jgi:hypothetical protein
MTINKERLNNKITVKEIKDAIQKSGYLLEQRVLPIFEKFYGPIDLNSIFPDPVSGKSREIDIKTLGVEKIFDTDDYYNTLWVKLLCECENNKQPTVFFIRDYPDYESEYFCEDIALTGIPIKFLKNDYFTSISDFLELKKFHHYCKGGISTQYCTFQQKQKKGKNEWMAFHSDEQHNTFDSLIKVLDYEIEEDFKSYTLPDSPEEETINITVYYPLLILQQDLYSAFIEGKNIILKKSKHIQFRKQYHSTYSKEIKTYQIDVITEGYLPKYLKIINKEVIKIKNKIEGRKDEVFQSINQIVKNIRGDKNSKNATSYREWLEL